MTPRQSRAARALLGWPQAELADRAGVSIGVVRYLEQAVSPPIRRNELALWRALEAAGVVFLDEPRRDGVAVRAARRRARKAPR